MSKVLVLAMTGLGKTTSIRDLPPPATGVINCDKKELPLRGWRKNYQTIKSAEGTVDFMKSNYIETAKTAGVLKALQEWEKNPAIRTIVLDTITHMITNEYMNNTVGKDFKAYQMLGRGFYDVIEAVRSSKKNVIVFGHIERKVNDMGEVMWDMKTHGKMITDLVPASYFTTVLVGEKRKKEDGMFDFLFRTQSEGGDPAKSPAYVEGTRIQTALDFYEPNNMATILEKLELFETIE